VAARSTLRCLYLCHRIHGRADANCIFKTNSLALYEGEGKGEGVLVAG